MVNPRLLSSLASYDKASIVCQALRLFPQFPRCVTRLLPDDLVEAQQPPLRGLHSSTFQLNLSAFRGIGGAFRGYLEGD